jgi:hypothetical protein
MKRDMDLIRKILLFVEEHPDPDGWVQIELEDHPTKEVSYHIKLLDQAGLIEAEDLSTYGMDGFKWVARSLTWRGHEFLNAARDDTRWNNAKKIVTEKGGGLIFEALQQFLIQGLTKAVLS